MLNLIEETKDLASNALAASFLMSHDSLGGGEDDVSELAGREQIGNPLLGIL